MALDPVVNFFRSEIATLPVTAGGVTIVLSTGDGAKLPDPAVSGAFNLTIYNQADQFASPEIVRVTEKSADTLTVTRAQEGTVATTKTAGATWTVVLTPTAKTIQDIDAQKLDVADIVNNLTSVDTDKPLSAAQGKVLQDGKLNLSGGTMTGDLTINSTGHLKIPSGTTAQRPGSPVAGMTRFNTTLGDFEYYNGTSWVSSGTVPIEYVVVGGGGNGAGHSTGGSTSIASAPGGGGGYRSSVEGENTGGGLTAEPKFLVQLNTSYSVAVGAAETPSNFAQIVALKGGTGRGGAGGSGGGGDFAATTGGLGTAGQGFNGGNYSADSSSGGGGGAAQAGANAVSSTGGNGGGGVASSITGSSVTRAGGGGGSGVTIGTGGSGGGANGRNTTGNGITSPTPNSGGGGGGAFSTAPGDYSGGAGASGIVILRYPATLSISVLTGSLTSSTATVGANKVTQFTAGSGTISFSFA